MQDHAGQVQTLLQQGAQVVVAPEKIVVLQEENIKAVDDLFAQAVAASRSDVVIGVARRAPKEWLNEARLHPGAYSCTCLQEAPYVAALRIKIHRWQLANNSAEPSGLWGVTICKDMDFPGPSREYGQEGGACCWFRHGILIPTVGCMHAWHMVRGVESGFSIARARRHGILTVCDTRSCSCRTEPGGSSFLHDSNEGACAARVYTLFESGKLVYLG